LNHLLRPVRPRDLAFLLPILLLFCLMALAGCAGDQAPDAAAVPTSGRQDSPINVDVTATALPESRSGLPIILYEDLPPEAQETIQLIDQGGPFPFSRDGITFQNREGILPPEPGGYYSEYTVITPGESDRGARRIVAGEEGELYYTDDHYESFKEVIR
jgi:ribonuclease T1